MRLCSDRTPGVNSSGSMENDYFYNADGELLVVTQLNGLLFFTEFAASNSRSRW